MDTSVLTAIIAATATLIAGYLSNFVAENYRRHCDRTGLAAAFAGEVSSYLRGMRMQQFTFTKVQQAAHSEGQDLPPFRMPTQALKDMVYEASVPKLGLLHPEDVELLTSFYHMVNAQRASYGVLCSEIAEGNQENAKRSVPVLLEFLSVGVEIGEKLVPRLHAAARRPFWSWGR